MRGEVAVSVLSVLVLAVIFRLARLPMPMLPALAAGMLAPGPVLRRAGGRRRRVPGGQHRGPRRGRGGGRLTVLVVVALERIVARRLLAARRPSPTLTVLLVVALVDAYGLMGLLFASTLAMTIESCLGRLLLTHPQARPPRADAAQLRERLEGTRRRLLLLPEPNATQLGSMVARLGALTADAESQLR